MCKRIADVAGLAVRFIAFLGDNRLAPLSMETRALTKQRPTERTKEDVVERGRWWRIACPSS